MINDCHEREHDFDTYREKNIITMRTHGLLFIHAVIIFLHMVFYYGHAMHKMTFLRIILFYVFQSYFIEKINDSD